MKGRISAPFTRSTDAEGISLSDRASADAFVLAASALGPTHRLPWRVRVVLPNPTATREEFERFALLDVPGPSQREAERELFQLRQADAQCDDIRDVPRWLEERAAALESHIDRRTSSHS